jgi:hypothetical protein
MTSAFASAERAAVVDIRSILFPTIQTSVAGDSLATFPSKTRTFLMRILPVARASAVAGAA